MYMRVLRSTFAAVLLTAGFLLPFSAFAANVGEAAPDFSLPDMHGMEQKLSSYAGSVIVLNFWATWCPECLAEIDALNRFAGRYGDKGVTVLSISVDKSEAALHNFLANTPVRYPVMVDETGDVFVRKYFIRGLPATIVIDRQGRIAAKMLGAQEFDSPEFTKRIDALIAGTP